MSELTRIIIMDQEKSFLGRGWSFPPTFSKEKADIEMVSKEEDIRQSLIIFFNTKLRFVDITSDDFLTLLRTIC